METKEKPVEIWLLLSVDNKSNDHNEVTLHPVTLHEDRWHTDGQPHYRNGDYDHNENPYGYELSQLEMFQAVYVTSYRGEQPRMGEYDKLCYRNIYAVELDLALRMAKTLDSIGKKLDKMYKEQGPVESFGQYALRFVRAIGAKGIIVRDEGSAISKGWSTTYDWHQIADAATIVYRVNQAADELHKAMNPEPVAIAA
jgi:hypothetical protein